MVVVVDDEDFVFIGSSLDVKFFTSATMLLSNDLSMRILSIDAGRFRLKGLTTFCSPTYDVE